MPGDFNLPDADGSHRPGADGPMTLVEQLARFAVRASYDDLSEAAREQLKSRVLDALACAVGALDGDPVRLLRAQVAECDGSGPCSLIGGGSATPDRAAFYNSALVRHLGCNDSYLTRDESCHPSDNFGAVLAAAEYARASGRDFLAALALAYQVQCRLSDVAPVRDAGFDHVTHGAYAVAAGCARALGLDPVRTAHAIAIAGAAFPALRVSRTGRLSQWAGLAHANVAGAAMRTTLLAGRGVTGPAEVFEGDKGFMDAVAGYFSLDWETENLERVTLTVLKKHAAAIHSQSAIEAVLALRAGEPAPGDAIAQVEVDIFEVAYRIIGGGEEGDRRVVHTREDALHSLAWLVAVALLDGEVTPAQYLPARIRAADVQTLLRRVTVRPAASFSRRFPGELPCRVRLILADGRTATAELADYPGFHTSKGRAWGFAREKLERLGGPHTTSALRDRIVATVGDLERYRVAELTQLLAAVGRPSAAA